MTTMNIITGENQPILRTVCKSVDVFDEALVKLSEDMKDTMKNGSEVEGIGIAAPQVGVDARVFLIKTGIGSKKKKKTLVIVNPEILELSEHQVSMEEGCLSLPGVYGQVKRPAKVRARWQNLNGDVCEKKFDGWDARIFLHEYDHINGKLFIDYL